MSEDGFISFVCPACRTEIEASLDMVGVTTECPACAARLVVPSAEKENKLDAESDGIVRHGPGDAGSSRQSKAQKNRTIRIELGDM